MNNEEKQLLPRTDAEMEAFIRQVCEKAEVPANGSTMTAVATFIMHLGQDVDSVELKSLVKQLHAALAKQAAYNVLDSIREKSREEAKAKTSDSGTVQEASEEVVSQAQG